MVNKVKSIAVNWLTTDLIEVEVDINNGLPSFTIDLDQLWNLVEQNCPLQE